MSYEWFKAAGGGLPFAAPEKSAPAAKQQIDAFLDNLEHALDAVEFFRPEEKRATMLINLKNIFARMQPTQQDIQTLSGVITALADGSQGSGARRHSRRRGSGASARADRGGQRIHVPSERTPARGLAKLMRRNPTDAERIFWDALTRDRRFAGRGFKRQTPIGPLIADLVSFPLRVVVESFPALKRSGGGGARKAPAGCSNITTPLSSRLKPRSETFWPACPMALNTVNRKGAETLNMSKHERLTDTKPYRVVTEFDIMTQQQT